jgi:hypothetical protein
MARKFKGAIEVDGTVNDHGIPSGSNDFVTEDSVQTLTNKTITEPAIGDFTNSQHDHSDTANGAANGSTLNCTGTNNLYFRISRGSGDTNFETVAMVSNVKLMKEGHPT